MKKTEKKAKISTRELEAEYMEHLDTDNDEMYHIKEAIRKLTPLQRKIYVTYLECGTYTDTAKAFKVAVPTVKKYLTRLTERITEYVCNHIKY